RSRDWRAKRKRRPQAGDPPLNETHPSLYTRAAMPARTDRPRRMPMDKAQEILIEALRQGTTTAGEQRLYRSGKLPGLFGGRSSVHAEAAAQGVRDDLIEIVRTETKGKTVVEWVRVTPKG